MTHPGAIAGRQHNPNRERFDFYPTDPRWGEALLSRVGFHGVVTEPCAGDGVLVGLLESRGYEVEAFDIDPRDERVDTRDTFDVTEYQNVMTNAPFKGGFEMVKHWLKYTTEKVCLLTQYGFLESGHRAKWFKQDPPVLIIMCPKRMKVGGKPSQFPHVWVVWDNSVDNMVTHFDWATEL